MIRIKRAFTLFLAAVLVLTGVYTQPVSAYADMSGNDMVPVYAEAAGTENTDISSAETEDAIIDDAEEEKEDDPVIIETEEEIEEPEIPDESEPVEEEADEPETVDNTYADEECIASGTINENMEWFITSDNVMTISGNDAMPDYSYAGQAPWFSNKNSIFSVVIDDGITHVGAFSFYDYDRITSITIADTVITIGKDAFWGEDGLKTVNWGSNVETIGEYAFEWCTGLESITIPSGVKTIKRNAFAHVNKAKTLTFETKEGVCLLTEIGEYAFQSCDVLTDFTIPDSVTTIKNNAFQYCKALKTVTIPKTVTSLGESVFANCYGLESAFVSFNKSRTRLSGYIFQSCEALTDVSFNDSYLCTSFGNYAFSGCKNLESVTIPKNVDSLGENAFSSCTKLKNVIFAEDIEGKTKITVIGNYCFNSCKGLTDFSIPSSVTTIGNRSFQYCESLAAIVIPENVTRIEDAAFEGCKSLTTITIPANVTTLGNYALKKCEGLQTASIAFNNSLTYVPSSLFEGDIALETITFQNEDKVKKIYGYAFKDCTSLTSFDVPDSVTEIQGDAFNGCTGLTTVSLGAALTKICGSAFKKCTAIETIDLPDTVTTIDSSAFEGCTGLKTFNINNTITKIGGSAFKGCTSLTEFAIPASVTDLSADAFSGCTNLTRIDVANDNTTYYSKYNTSGAGGVYLRSNDSLYIRPEGNTGVLDVEEGVTVLSSVYYKGNTEITEVTIPASVKIIDQEAFKGCTNLKTVKFAANSALEEIRSNAFKDCTSLETINIPEGFRKFGGNAFDNCKSLKGFTIPAGVTDFPTSMFNNCAALESVTVADGNEKWNSSKGIVYQTTNNNKMYFWPAACHYFPTGTTSVDGRYRGNKYLTEITIPSTVTSIGTYAYAFQNCTALKTVIFEDGISLTSIPSSTFEGCTALETITLPASITYVGSSAFKNCSSLKKITLPASVKTIGNNAFCNCTALTTVNLPSNLEIIEYSAFVNCKKLGNVTFPSNLTTIGSNAFEGCEAFTKVTIPNSVTTIEGSAFKGCIKVTEVTISNSLTQLNSYTFMNMTALKTVTFNATSSVKNINYAAFADCTALTSITLPKSLTDFNTYAFSGCTSLKSVNIEAGNTVYKSTDGIVYKVSDGSLYYKPEGNSSDPVKPKKTYYDSSDYRDEKNKKVVTIPKEVTVIKAEAFKGASELTTIKFASGSKLTTIESKAFYNCKKLKSITLPGTVTSIGNQAFYSCYALTKVNLPANLTTIGYQAYYNCSNIKTVKFGSKITTIGYGAFKYCAKLTSISLPGSLQSIEEEAFCNCDKLKSVKIATGEGTKELSWGNSVFRYCKSLTEVKLPSGIKSIGKRAFSEDVKLKKIVLPEGLKSIGQYAFDETAITDIVIPESIKEIGDSAFYGLSALKTITFKGNVESIANYAFSNCNALTAINLPDSVKTIGTYAFSSSGLKTISIPEGVTALAANTFNNCTSLTRVAIPSSVETIDLSAFYGTTSLRWIEVAKDNEVYSSSDGMLYKDGKLIYCPLGWDETKKLIVPQGATEIAEKAFYQNDTITDIIIPATVTKIGNNAFSNCNRLKTVTFEEGSQLTAIPFGAFYQCRDLNRVTFEGNTALTSIGAKAFYECYDLTEISFENNATDIAMGDYAVYCDKALTGIYSNDEPAKLGSLGSYVFYGCESLQKLVFGQSCSKIDGIYPFYNCRKLTDITVVDGNETFYSTDGVLFKREHSFLTVVNGTLGSLKYQNAIFAYPEGRVSSMYVVPEGTSGAMKYSFYNVSALDGITLPDSFRFIDDYAFAWSGIKTIENVGTLDVLMDYTFRNTPLTSIDLSGFSGHFIGDYSFYQCTSLKEVVLPEEITEVYDCAFYNCSALVHMNLPDCIERVYQYAFYGCYNWEEAHVPTSVTCIDDYAFYNCDRMDDIVIPVCCVKIGEHAFQYCGSSTLSFDVDISGNSQLESIGFDAFSDVTNITEVEIPEGVRTIGSFAFDSCTKLKKITFPSTLKSLGTGSFNNGNYQGNFTLRFCHPDQVIIKNPDLTIWKNFFFNSTSATSESRKKVVYIYADTKGSDGEDSKIYKYFSTYSEAQCVPKFVDINDLGVIGKDPYISVVSGEDQDVSGNVYLYEIDKYAFSLETGESVLQKPTGSGVWTYDTVSGKLTVTITDGEGKLCDSPWSAYQNSIKSVDISGNITAIDTSFYNYGELKEVILPAELVSLTYQTFEYCGKLEKVKFAEGSKLSKIGNYAFMYCYALKNIEIPDTVTEIGESAFYYCSTLESISFPASLKSTGYTAFGYCNSLTEVNIDKAFEIGESMFYQCKNLKTVTLCDGITTIPYNMFYGCPIEEIRIPASVSEIATDAFAGMDALNSVIIDPDNITYENVDEGVLEKATGRIVWTKHFVDAEGHKLLYIHKKFTVDDLIHYIYDTSYYGVVVDDENPYFALYDNAVYSKDGTILYYVPKNREGKVIVRDNTKKIYDSAFRNCSKITEIVIPDSVNEIGYAAFNGATLLAKIELPEKITYIDSYLFNYCKSLKAITIPKNVTSIGTYAFANSGLTDLIIPEGVTSVGVDAFYNCTSLRSAIVPSSLSRLENYTFYQCSKLTDLRLSPGLKEIGQYALAYTGLSKVVLPEGLKKIDNYAFYYSSSLTRIDVPESVDDVYISDWYYSGSNTISNLYTPFDFCSYYLTLYGVKGSYIENWCTNGKVRYYDDGTWIHTPSFSTVEDYVKYSITYMLDREAGELNSKLNPSSYRSIDDTIELHPATKPGFAFGGWYKDAAFNFEIKSIVPAFEGGNIVLYPQWLTEHDVTLMADGTEYAHIKVADGYSLLKAGAGTPEKEGYRFIGWMGEDGNAFGDKEPVTTDLVLNALFVSNAEAGVFAPTSNLKSGRVENGTYVTLATETLGALIYYTTDKTAVITDSVLAENATEYTDTVEISGETGEVVVIKAVAVKDGIYSKPVVYSYEIADSSGDWGDIALSDRAGYETADDVPEGIWFAGYTDSTVYSGSKKTFDIRVYHNNKLLKEKTDYSITYKNNVNAYTLTETDEGFNKNKAPGFTITGKGNYKDSVTKYFVIRPADILLTSPVIKAGITSYSTTGWSINVYDYTLQKYTFSPVVFDRLAYNGKKQQIAPSVSFNGKKLKKDKDYSITWSSENDQGYKEPGTYKVTVTGIGNFSGIAVATYTIEKEVIAISKAKVQGLSTKYEYTGSSIAPEITLTYGGKELIEYRDYTYEYTNNMLPGKATLMIFGLGKYKGTMIKTFKINSVPLKKVKVENLAKSVPYTGKEVYEYGYSLTITTKIKSGGRTYTEKTTLKPGTDYTTEYKNNLKAGTATITFTGKGKYTGTIKKTFKITPFDTAVDAKLKYPKVVVKMDEQASFQTGGTQPKPVVTFKGLVLKEGTDYKLTYKNNTKIVNAASAGKKAPSVTVTFKGNFKGRRTLNFDIVKGNISALSATAADCEYTGKGGAPAAVITINDKNGKALKANTDFTCTYFYEEPVTLTGGTKKNAKDEVQSGDIIPAGATLRVKISGTGNYEGSLEAVYHVVAANVAKASVTVKADSKFIYSGKGLTPRKSDLTVSLGGVELSPSDYEITECKNNVENGKKATFTIKGISNNYGGTKTVTFVIDKRSVK
ncbi:MAG: leucine-rich repeat protein [Lachnospiraceae bacterium]|nr:leucine-rich repeat protein [Lachnospiraceae bacterium]